VLDAVEQRDRCQRGGGRGRREECSEPRTGEAAEAAAAPARSCGRSMAPCLCDGHVDLARLVDLELSVLPPARDGGVDLDGRLLRRLQGPRIRGTSERMSSGAFAEAREQVVLELQQLHLVLVEAPPRAPACASRAPPSPSFTTQQRSWSWRPLSVAAMKLRRGGEGVRAALEGRRGALLGTHLMSVHCAWISGRWCGFGSFVCR